MEKLERLNVLLDVAWSHLSRPYIWGGDDPIKGFDCSGFVIECLRSVGMVPQNYDNTASGLFQEFKAKRVDEPYEGCLVFWKNSEGRIIHIEICLNDELCIGASGGGSSNTTMERAIQSNAYVRIKPIQSRSGIAGYVDPFMEV